MLVPLPTIVRRMQQTYELPRVDAALFGVCRGRIPMLPMDAAFSLSVPTGHWLTIYLVTEIDGWKTELLFCCG